MTRRIGHLDTPDKCRKECERVYKQAWKGDVTWQEAQEATAVLERLSNMCGGNNEQAEGNFGDVGKNALRR
jgi:hypothetical protein